MSRDVKNLTLSKTGKNETVGVDGEISSDITSCSDNVSSGGAYVTPKQTNRVSKSAQSCPCSPGCNVDTNVRVLKTSCVISPDGVSSIETCDSSFSKHYTVRTSPMTDEKTCCSDNVSSGGAYDTPKPTS